MSRSADYRRHARECIRFAAGAKDKDERKIFMDMADAFARVAVLQSDAARQLAFDDNVTGPSVN